MPQAAAKKPGARGRVQASFPGLAGKAEGRHEDATSLRPQGAPRQAFGCARLGACRLGRCVKISKYASHRWSGHIRLHRLPPCGSLRWVNPSTNPLRAVSQCVTVLWVLNPLVLKARCFGGSSWVVLKVGVPCVGSQPSAPQGEAQRCEAPPGCGSLRWGRVCGRTESQPFLPLRRGLFPFAGRAGAAQPGLGSVPEQIAPRVAVDSACLWQDVSSGSSCRHL